MGNDPIHLAVESSENENEFFMTQKYAIEAIRIIKECESEAKKILTKNKMLLLKIAEYLTVNSRMAASLIEEYVRRYGPGRMDPD